VYLAGDIYPVPHPAVSALYDAGIVLFEHRCFNQRGEEVAYCKRSALMRKRPA